MTLLVTKNANEYRRFLEIFSPDKSHVREHGAKDGVIGDYGFAEVHARNVLELRPERVLCIGSRYGFIPAYIAWACRESGLKICVDFVDANYDDDFDGFAISWGGQGAWYRPMERFTKFGLEQYVNMHVRRSDEYFPVCRHKYGYFYFDGNHSYEGVGYDFGQAQECAAPGAVFTFHDALVREKIHEIEFGVWRLLEGLDRAKWDVHVVGPWPGLGVVQRVQGN